MGHQEGSSRDNLNNHLYSNDNLNDRLLQGNKRTLRSNHTGDGDRDQKASRRDDAAVRKLEREMDRLTDPLLLGDAREYQQGQCKKT